MRVAAATDTRESRPPFGHVTQAALAPTGDRRLRIRHISRRRREGPLAVARAIPHGRARARTQRGWLEDVAQHPKMLLRRADAQANILAVARVLAAYANWETMLTRPTWAVLMERTGFSRSTVAAHLAWLRSVGLLGLVAGGTTPQFSPGILRDDEHEQNEAAVYVLCAPSHLRLVALPHPDDAGAEFVNDGRDDDVYPPVTECAGDTTRTPTPSRREEDPRARETEIHNLQDPQLKRPVPAWPAHQRPATRPERTTAALEARRRLPVLARISTPYVAALLRQWHLAGWTLTDVLAALSHRPDGSPWHHADRVRDVPGWIRHRLAPWRSDPTDPTSPPGRSPSQRAHAAATHQRALARAHREHTARLAGDRLTHPHAHHIAALRAATQPAQPQRGTDREGR